jgi:Tol biopolymer transport system component
LNPITSLTAPRWRLLIIFQALLAHHAILAAAPHPDVASSSLSSSISGAAGSYGPVFSSDGRFLIFLSYARNLLPAQEPGMFLNIYAKDLQTGGISLVTQSAVGQSGGNGSSISPSISSNGEFIAFQSAASNLIANDTNGFMDIFLRDTVKGTTTLISVDAAGNGQGNGESVHPLISPEGRFIAFESSASNLTAGDTNRIIDVFVRDRITGTTTRASVGSLGAPGSSFGSQARSQVRGITPDGKRVLFESSATNLVSNPAAGSSEIYVRDLEGAVTYWASSGASDYVAAPRRVFNSAMSDDGHKVAFKTTSDSTSSTLLLVHDLDAGTTQLLSSDTFGESAPLLNSDGHLLISENRPTNAPPGSGVQVTLWDLVEGTNTLLIPTEGPGAWPTNSFRPAWARGGTRVAFFASPNSIDAAGKAQLFVRDLETGQLGGPALNGKQILFEATTDQIPSLNNTGNVLAFDLAEDLFPGDNNADWDVLAYSWNTDSVELISRNAGNNTARTAGAFNITGRNPVSADGRLVVWATTDTNGFFGAVTNGYPFRVAIWDTVLHQNVTAQLLGNIASPQGSTPPGITNFSASPIGPMISADGSTLTYLASFKAATQSFPENLYTLNFNTASFSLIRTQDQSAFSFVRPLNPSVSGGGRFTTYEDTLNPQSGSGKMDVFVYDSEAKTNMTVSLNAAGNATGSGDSTNALISPNGRWVLFQSTATDLVSGLSSYPSTSVFVRDLSSNITSLVSFGANHAPMSVIPGTMAWSTNSRVAAFSGLYNVSGSVLVPRIMVYDALSRTNRLACTNCQNPSLDGTGRWLAYESLSTTATPSQVFVKDLRNDEQTLISHNANFSQGGNGSSTAPLISGDARFVIFASKAGDLVLNDHNNKSDIFAHDRLLGTTTLLSLNQQGTESGNGPSARPAISADGRTVVFQSLASDLVDGDYTGFRDVFIAKIGSSDSDHDGMDDDWEVAYFGNLSRDGQGDFDGDGQTDLQEFRSGTDPTNQGSFLRVITLTKVPEGAATVVWSSVPGKSYRVEHKDDLGSNIWIALPGLVTASSTSSSKEDPSPSPQRFYRVVSTE